MINLNLGYKVYLVNILSNEKLAEQMFQSLENGAFDYLELYVQPGDIARLTVSITERLRKYNVIIHAPHLGNNFNPSLSSEAEIKNNMSKIKDSLIASTLFDAKIIVFHCGTKISDDSLRDNINFIKLIPKSYQKLIAIENLPLYASDGKGAKTSDSYIGNNAEDIRQIIEETGVMFCLDFSHAICSAVTSGRDPIEVVNEYNELKPAMYHLCDGLTGVDADFHWHLGTGNYPILDFINICKDKPITIETGKTVPTDCYIQIQDINYARTLVATASDNI